MFELLDRRFSALILAIVPRWCKPNHITGIRIVLIPLIWYCYHEVNVWAGAAMFSFLALTDFVDGRVARGRGLVTRGGKVLDVSCDIMLVWSTVILLWKEGLGQSHSLLWLLGFILFRELVVTGVRFFFGVRAKNVRVNILGKCKTGFLMMALGVLITSSVSTVSLGIGIGLLVVAAFCSFLSGIQYIHQFATITERR